MAVAFGVFGFGKKVTAPGGPLNLVHVPVPAPGVFPPNPAEINGGAAKQIFCGPPTVAAPGFAEMFTVRAAGVDEQNACSSRDV